MQEISLHILDIVENSIRAKANTVEITVIENAKKNQLLIQIKDNGQGMNPRALKQISDPLFTSKKNKKTGLGVALLARAAEESGGKCIVQSKENQGTKIQAYFIFDHIDRQPLGNIADTLLVLFVTHGDKINFIYKHRRDNNKYVFDLEKFKKQIGGMPVSHPKFISNLRKDLKKFFNSSSERSKK